MTPMYLTLVILVTVATFLIFGVFYALIYKAIAGLLPRCQWCKRRIN